MKCQNEKCCDGQLDFSQSIGIIVVVGFRALIRETVPCGKCGRLHFVVGGNAYPAERRQGIYAFLEDGQIVDRDENGVERGRVATGRPQ